MNPVFRFAPSLNGRLHLGHAYSALLNASLATQLKGLFLIRLEDIDTTRCTEALAKKCLEDLTWLGAEGEKPVRIQSHHWEDYANALNRLKEKGLVYPCFCTRRDIAEASEAKDPDGATLYSGTCKQLPAEEIEKNIARKQPHAWRVDMNKALADAPGPHYYKRFLLPGMQQETVTASPVRWGDAILARKEIPTSYHLSVVVDDALQGITHIVRGEDLEAATCLHVLLQSLLQLPTPLYHHHALLRAPEGDKLAKSKGSETLKDLRARGLTPADVRALLPLP